MDKNIFLYNGAKALIEASKFVTHIDQEYAIEMLNKAEEFKNMIVIDEKENEKIGEYKKLIEEH
jgi:hypothetical protein